VLARKKRRKGAKNKTKEGIELFLGAGINSFSINEVATVTIDSSPISVGISAGGNIPITKIIPIMPNYDMYLSPYLSYYTGASYKLNYLDDNYWENATMLEIGVNVAKRFNLGADLYISPFVGIKYQSFNTQLGEVAEEENEFKQTGAAVPVGFNFAFAMNRQISIFTQLSIHAVEISKDITVGDKKAAASDTNNDFGVLFGLVYKL
jgi:hypothetical protein